MIPTVLTPTPITQARAERYNTRWLRQAEQVARKSARGGFLNRREQALLAKYKTWLAAA